MKRLWTSLLAMLLVFAILMPAGAIAEGLEIEQNSTNDEGLELPEDAAVLDLALDEVIVLDGLQSPQDSQGEFSEKPGEDSLAEKAVPEAETDISNATKYGVPATLTLGVKEAYAIKCTKSGKLTYKTSNKKIATVSSKGAVTGKKKGSVTITVYRNGKKLTTCKVKVVAAPKKVTLNKTSLSLKVGRTFQLVASVNSGSHARYTWSSSNKSVATVSSKGLVTAKESGSATITVKTHNGKKAACKVKVTKGNTSTLRVSPTSMTLYEGDSQDVTLTYTVDGTVYYDISDKSIVTLEQTSGWNGNDTTLTIYAHSAGSATVTFTNNANSDSACLYVTVNGNGTPEPQPEDESGDSSVTYRALLIGEEDFPNDRCSRNRGDVTLMSNMLNSVKGPAGGRYNVTRRYDLNRTGVMDAIRNTFSGADNDDVSLFFIATHGDSESNGSNAGALALIGSSYEEQWLIINDLANALKAVPGKVIVIIESCGSGAAIYSTGVTENSGNRLRNASSAHDDAIISAFSAADHGVKVRLPGAGRSIIKGAPTPNTGEMRVENKFYVLTATRYHEDSWGTEDGPYNYFTKWLTDGIGTSGSMPADANGNWETTLAELFNYISRVGDDEAFYYQGTNYYQHVQVYPKNSAYGLFRR